MAATGSLRHGDDEKEGASCTMVRAALCIVLTISDSAIYQSKSI